MKMHIHHHNIVSNHLILETNHETFHNSTKHLAYYKKKIYQIWLFWYTLIYIKICYIHIDLTDFNWGDLLNCFYHGLNLYENLAALLWVPCKTRSSVNSGGWLWMFDDVSGVDKTDILRRAMRTKRK